MPTNKSVGKRSLMLIFSIKLNKKSFTRNQFTNITIFQRKNVEMKILEKVIFEEKGCQNN